MHKAEEDQWDRAISIETTHRIIKSPRLNKFFKKKVDVLLHVTQIYKKQKQTLSKR